MISFRSKRDKERLLEKARKMEEYASMIVECIEDSKEYDEDFDERSYRDEEEMMDRNDKMMGRYGYNRRRMR
jgi:hypothetical protein